MSLDIDDILAELDRDTTAVEMSSDGINLQNDASVDIMNSSLDGTNVAPKGQLLTSKVRAISPVEDFNKLKTLWKNERCSPELLPYPHQLMRRMLIRIQEQMEHLEILSMNFFEESAGGGGNGRRNGNAPANNNKMLPLLCMEAELERVKFVIRSYIRCRLSKVDKYSIYLRQINEQFLNEEHEEGDMNTETRISPLEALLSSEEIKYHQKHFSLLLNLLNESVLKYMSDDLQAINDTEGTVNMIDEPDWNKFVFIKVNGPPNGENEFDPLLIHKLDPDRYYYSITIPETNEDIELIIGSIYIVRYNLIKDLLKDDKIELL
ncbi:DNA replication complex GINS protein Sld5p [Monosporozyma servazzii]